MDDDNDAPIFRYRHDVPIFRYNQMIIVTIDYCIYLYIYGDYTDHDDSYCMLLSSIR